MSVEPSSASARSLTVICAAGLANRLRVLVSGLALAEASERMFRMMWPRTRSCGAAFRELFAGDWPVTDVDAFDRAWEVHRVAGWLPSRPPVPLDDPRPHIVILANNWLIEPTHRASPPALTARYAELLAQLAPVSALAERIAEFRARHFRTVMIGVHLRRGDFLRQRPDVAGNTPEALAAVDRFLAQAPGAGILLCTDDGGVDPATGREGREGVAERFRARYGDRVVTTAPRSLDRRTVEGIQDALVDLQLLRATQMVVGTTGSSFSSLAALGRDLPRVSVRGSRPGYRAIDRLLRVTGVQWVVCRIFFALHGYDRPFPMAWSQLVQPVRRWARKTR